MQVAVCQEGEEGNFKPGGEIPLGYSPGLSVLRENLESEKTF